MDTPLLAKMVKELILEHDAVTLPGIGIFVAQLMPSTFTDKGYTITPPYRRLSFSQREGVDTLLADLYARSNNVTVETALQILSTFLASLREELISRKTVTLPELGRLRATRENNFFFIADENLDIYPEGFGLEPLSLKTHEETPEEVSSAVAGLATLLSEEPASAEEPDVSAVAASAPGAEPTGDKFPQSSDEGPSGTPRVRRKRRWVLRVLLVLLILAAIFFAAFFAAAAWAPDWLDTLLSSPEELEILRA